MRTHGHGQGYADANFLIPELLAYVLGAKGPITRMTATSPQPARCTCSIRTSSQRPIPGHRRKLRLWPAAGRHVLSRFRRRNRPRRRRGRHLQRPLGAPRRDAPDQQRPAVDAGTQDDGCRSPVWPTPTAGIRPTRFRSARSTAGLFPLWGSIDPTDGGDTTRFSLSGRWSRDGGNQPLAVEAYAIAPTLDLYNNFTYYLGHQPTDSAISSASSIGAPSSASTPSMPSSRRCGLPVETRIGLQSRYDDIRVGLQDSFNAHDLPTPCQRLGGRRQRRGLDRHDREMDAVAANDGRLASTISRQHRRLQSPRRRCGFRRWRPDRPPSFLDSMATFRLCAYRAVQQRLERTPRCTAPKPRSWLGLFKRPNSFSTLAKVSIRPTRAEPSPTLDVRPHFPTRRCSVGLPHSAAGEVARRGNRHGAPNSIDGLELSLVFLVAQFRFRKPVRGRHRHHDFRPSEPALRHRIHQSLFAGLVDAFRRRLGARCMRAIAASISCRRSPGSIISCTPDSSDR